MNKLYGDIQNALSKKGINAINGDIYDFISIWKEWYRGTVNDFHFYDVKLADGTSTEVERLTMNMPKKVCEDFSKLLWSEKVQIELESEKKTNQLWNVLDSKINNFSVMFPQFLEKAFAVGTGVTVQYKVNDTTKIEYIDGETVMPYAYDNGYISGFVTISQFTQGTKSKKTYFTHLTYHEFKKVNGIDKYIKYNELYKSSSATALGREISFEDMFPDVENPVTYETDTPHFQLWKPNIANNLDLDTPMGISVFANHLDKFKAIDTKYDSFNNEFELGKKMVLVDRSAIKTAPTVNPDGTVTNVSYFDKNNKVFQAINGMEQQPVKEIDFKLRHEEHIRSINADLNYLSAGVGLGQNYYEFDGESVKTATEVISENSDTYRTKMHHQIIVKDALYDLVKSIMFLEGIKSKEINISFDDSIIEDENSRRKEGREKVSMGVLSKKTYLMEYEHMTEEEANEELMRIREDNKIITPDGLDFFGESNQETDQTE